MAVAVVSSSASSQKLTALEQLEKWIIDPPENSRVFTITAKTATYLLDKYNTRNRPKKNKKIAEFAADMADGQFPLTGDTIKFDSSSRLADGQNRLYACEKSGKSFRTHVVFGVDPEVFPWLDRGKPRSGSDALHLEGITNAREVARMIRWLELFKRGEVKNKNVSFTPNEIIEAYKTYDVPLMEEAVRQSGTIYKADGTSRPLASALFYLMSNSNRPVAIEFFNAWATGNFAGRFEPMKKASRILAETRKLSPLNRVDEIFRVAVWITAWNFVIARHKGNAQAFRWKSDKPLPDIK